jgi:RNA polymerase sigma-70 factor (ECF subfamily)
MDMANGLQTSGVDDIGEMFHRYQPSLYADALRICRDVHTAKDAVQDTFILAYTNRHTLRNTERLYPWMRRILTNSCYQILRRERSIPIDDHIYDDRFIYDSIESHIDESDERLRLYDSLGRLSDELRSCMMLRYFSHINSYTDIAAVLGIPVGTVRSRLAAAREQLKSFYLRNNDPSDTAVRDAEEWNERYNYLWGRMYDDANVRNMIFEHFDRNTRVRFSGAKLQTGRHIIEREIDQDLFHGSRFEPTDIMTSGNISVIDGVCLNSKEYPDRCPPISTMVVVRTDNCITAIHLYFSQKQLS